MKILIADEADDSRQTLSLALKSAGHDVIGVSNGADALGIVTGQAIDLFISEVNMPELDGISLLKIIRGDKDQRNLPVLILTAESDEDMITEARLAGADAWMIKPFKPELLHAAVEKLFTEKKHGKAFS